MKPHFLPEPRQQFVKTTIREPADALAITAAQIKKTADDSYFMLEGTDGQVHYVYYTPELEAARSQGGLRTNSFVRLRKLFAEGHPSLKIDELGDSDRATAHTAW